MQIKVEEKVSSDHAGIKNISAEVSIFCLWTNWIHLARWTKSLKSTLSIAVHRGGLAKNDFWLVATQKKRIGEQLNYFWNMCPKPFSWAKNKRKLFFRREVQRIALSESCTWLIVSIVFRVWLWSLKYLFTGFIDQVRDFFLVHKKAKTSSVNIKPREKKLGQ